MLTWCGGLQRPVKSKVLLLAACCLCFRSLKHPIILLRHGREAETLSSYAAFLRDEILLRSDAVPALGLSLHLADIAVTELRGACEEGSTEAAVPWPALKVRLQRRH